MNDKRIRVIIGHYGSGKTEFSVNYAIGLAEQGKKVSIVDLDVVNLYFRSREKSDVLEAKGIRVIGSSLKGNAVDLPAISGEVVAPLQDKSYSVILDIGGDPAGARTLARYKEYLTKEDSDIFFVLNAYRPETSSVEKAHMYLKKIEDTIGLRVTGIINNTHMLKSTEVKDVVYGYEMAKKLSELTHIPLKYNACLSELIGDLPERVKENAFPITLYMREEWMI